MRYKYNHMECCRIDRHVCGKNDVNDHTHQASFFFLSTSKHLVSKKKCEKAQTKLCREECVAKQRHRSHKNKTAIVRRRASACTKQIPWTHMQLAAHWIRYTRDRLVRCDSRSTMNTAWDQQLTSAIYNYCTAFTVLKFVKTLISESTVPLVKALNKTRDIHS